MEIPPPHPYTHPPTLFLHAIILVAYPGTCLATTQLQQNRGSAINHLHLGQMAMDATLSRRAAKDGREQMMNDNSGEKMNQTPPTAGMRWSFSYIVRLLGQHPSLCLFGLSLLFFMGVEYTIRMIPSTSPPFDIGFVLTHSLNNFLSTHPSLNSVLAALNTVFVVMQTTYIIWTLLMEGRPRATISALFMFTCRGILGCSTQLPLPKVLFLFSFYFFK